jgi:hypothetical protein
MVQRKVVSIAVVSILLMFVFGNSLSYSQQAQEPEEPEVPDLRSWTQLSEDHQEIDMAAPCMLCHNYKVDATTTATKQMVRIGKQLEKEALWKRISEHLGAGKKTRTFVMATSLNNIPLSTTCDQMLDPDKKVLYAFFEVGTEKLNHLRENAHVSLNWHKPWENNFSTVLCVQVRGRAELFDGLSPVFDEAVRLSFPGLPAENREELSSRAKKNMVVCRITIDQAVLFDGVLLTQGMSSYQMWQRVDTYSPSYYTDTGGRSGP